MKKERLGTAKVKPIAQTTGGAHYQDSDGKAITEKEFLAAKNKKTTKEPK